MSGSNRCAGVLACAIVLLSCVHTAALAQSGTPAEVLPVDRYFPGGFADPIEPRMSIGVLVTDVLGSMGSERDPFVLPDPDDAASDWQAHAAIGATIPLIRFGQSEHGGWILAAQAGVFARFRIEYPSRDDLGQDWLVAGALEHARDQFSGRVRISHRSSHLGDEFVQLTDAERVEFGGEALDLNAAWTFPGIARVYGGATWIFRSYTANLEPLLRDGIGDCCVLQIGADGTWQPFPDPRLEIVAGADWQTAERIRWKSHTSLAGGLTWRQGKRSAGFVARFFDGRSALGQFYDTQEQYIGLEFLVTF